MRHVGFGLVQQLQEPCGACNGEGETIKPKDRCKACSGNRTIEEEKFLDVFVDKGMAHGQQIVFSGEGDQIPDVIPGDIILVLQQEQHGTFKRDGSDLYIEKEIKLIDALCGFKFIITHLDGRQIIVSSSKGQIIKPGDTKCIDGEGMPQHKNPFEKGRLYVKFDVVFPVNGSITTDHTKLLTQVLGDGDKVDVSKLPEDVEEAVLSEPTTSTGGKGSKGRKKQSHSHHGHPHAHHHNAAYQESDEEEDEEEGGGGGGPGVACTQQ